MTEPDHPDHVGPALAALSFFFFNDTATTEIYTLSLHDALPIFGCGDVKRNRSSPSTACTASSSCTNGDLLSIRSEEHTSELQSLAYLVCRLLLEKKKKIALRRRPVALELTHDHGAHDMDRTQRR